MRKSALLLLCLTAAGPTTKPAGDDLLGYSKPAAGPTTGPITPTTGPAFKPDADDGRIGTITLSDGKTVHGKITTTAEKPVRVWNEPQKKYEDFPLSMVESVDVVLDWERDEKEWNFKESGSDVKVYSGRTYPARQMHYKFKLTDDTTVEGPTILPLYVQLDAGTKTFVLHKRDKGDMGQKLTDVVYVKHVEFDK